LRAGPNRKLSRPDAGGTRQRTVELPGGVLPEEATEQRAPNFFDRLIGNDDRPNVGPCPLMGVLYDSSRLVAFTDAGNQRYANISHTGEMQGIRGLCRYVDADPIRMSIEVDMAFGRGPAATDSHETYRYWVAVDPPWPRADRESVFRRRCTLGS
jgi:hypothetical protein